MQLELKHICGYLPYKLKGLHTYFWPSIADKTKIVTVEFIGTECIIFLETLSDYYFENNKPECDFKPLLRPLSDLTREIEYNEERFVPAHKLAELVGDIWFNDEYSINQFVYEFVNGYIKMGIYESFKVTNFFYEYHFDIHRLIDCGLAVDINSINL